MTELISVAKYSSNDRRHGESGGVQGGSASESKSNGKHPGHAHTRTEKKELTTVHDHSGAWESLKLLQF